MAKPVVCYENTDIDSPIRLIQTGKDRFTVEYGLSRTKDLDYIKAATELGASLMHALACMGKLDNRRKGEK